MSRVIYVVEDDYLHREWIVTTLRQNFNDLEVKEIKTHSGFESSFKTIADDHPAAVIMDVMLQWKDDAVAKDAENLESYRRAGLECARMLAKDPRTAKVPVIFYSVLERANLRDVPKGAIYLSKGSKARDLIACVKGALAGASSPQV
jgi:CheY-like chemotaxis protein